MDSEAQGSTDSGSERLSRRQLLARATVLAAAATLIGGNEAALIVDVTTHRVPMRGLNRPIRVAQISDLHRSWCVSDRFVGDVVQRTNALKPDVVLLTGDYVTRSSAYMESCGEHLASLRAPLGVFAILGNHDYWCDQNRGARAIRERLRSVGAELLINRNEKLDCGLRLVGLDDCRAGRPDIEAGFRRIGPAEPVLAMTHNPLLFPSIRDRRCVAVAGHTHGGQIMLPYVTEAIFYQRTPYLRGWYHTAGDPSSLYVCRGLGTVHLPMRINSTPEIACFDLLPA